MIPAAGAHPIAMNGKGGVRMDWRLDPQQKRKYQAAERLGFTARLIECGWPGLSAKETGQVGAMIRYAPPQQE